MMNCLKVHFTRKTKAEKASKSSRDFSLTVAGLRAPLSRFLEGALYKYPE